MSRLPIIRTIVRCALVIGIALTLLLAGGAPVDVGDAITTSTSLVP